LLFLPAEDKFPNQPESSASKTKNRREQAYKQEKKVKTYSSPWRDRAAGTGIRKRASRETSTAQDPRGESEVPRTPNQERARREERKPASSKSRCARCGSGQGQEEKQKQVSESDFPWRRVAAM
jgi:hypothetical protein